APDVVDDGVADDRDVARLAIDLDLTDVGAVRERDRRRREGRRLAESWLHALRKLARHIGRLGDARPADAFVGARDRELPALECDVLGRGLEQVRGDATAVLDDLLAG